MAGYRLLTYASAGGPRAGLAIGEQVYDAASLTGRGAYSSVVGILDDWAAARERLARAADGSAHPATAANVQPLAAVRLMAPVLWPSAIYCAGANYSDHAAEMAPPATGRRSPIRIRSASSPGTSSRPAAARSRPTAT